MSVDIIRRIIDWADVDHPNAPRDAREQQVTALATLAALVAENNALRRNTERLQRRVDGLLKEVADAKLDAGHARSANRTAQTMAQHWRIKAEGGNYDVTKEEGP